MSILDLTISVDGAVADLRNRVGGAVLTERDPNYAEACAAWNLVFQHRPGRRREVRVRGVLRCHRCPAARRSSPP